MAVIPNFFHDSVVAIGQKNENSEPTWLATGFIVARQNEGGEYNIFLVSNRHVFECGLKQLIVRFNLEGELTAKDYEVDLFDDNNAPDYTVHPNPNIDVACLIVSNAKGLVKDIGRLSTFVLDVHTLSRKEMLEQDVVEGSLVYSLGFPAGRVNSGSKMPICRLGCISRIKETINDEGYLLDIQNFPGSSGSPIINKLETSYLEGTSHCDGTYLIGIIASYYPFVDFLQIGNNTQVTRENSGIAIAYSVDAIKETVEIEYNRNMSNKNNSDEVA